MLAKKASPDAAVIAVVAAAFAGVIGFILGRQNHAERTAAAEKLAAQYAADRAASLLENKRYIEETTVAQAKARAQERADAEKLAAMSAKQRQVFEEERTHAEKLDLQRREVQGRLSLAAQAAQLVVDAENRKANAQEALARETRQLRRDLVGNVWRYY